MTAKDQEFASLEWLYQEIILDHFKRPRNMGTVDGADVSEEEDNPFCGDRIGVQLKIRNGVLEQVRFSGRGCAISQASASMMTEKVTGMTVQEALEFAEEFRKAMRGDKPFPQEGQWDDLDALRGVRDFPVRIKCATLAWDVLQRSLMKWLHQKS
ncbi:MAG: SUF system NifU family Fe-S cluster assembly protein [Armatimonadetes bacterium]|nr:SUF system NifU family Fe-S cluster assembly protein [Armatimonadota bacterium]MDW8121878.1 SUF system NifU family Fe-S cluster assembly protein [Armatimonadota bacterium]